MPPSQFSSCDNHERLQAVEQTMTDIKAANRTWGIAISGILGGISLLGVPFLLWLASSVSAHDNAIGVVKTKIDNQEARLLEMSSDIKSILSELRKRP